MSGSVLARSTWRCSPSARGLLHLACLGRGIRKIGVHEHADHGSLGHHLVQQLQLLWPQPGDEKHHAGGGTARPTETGDEPSLDRVQVAHDEDDRNRRRRRLDRERRDAAAGGRE